MQLCKWKCDTVCTPCAMAHCLNSSAIWFNASASTELTDVTVDVNWNWSSIASVYCPPNDAYAVVVANNFHIIASYSCPNAQNQIVVITNPSMVANHVDLHKNQNQIRQIYQLQNQLPWHNQRHIERMYAQRQMRLFVSDNFRNL